MLFSLAVIFLCGMLLGGLCKKLKLPPLLGMLLTGILLGPHALDVLDGSILAISADLRRIALIIILTRAGLNLELADLKRAGRPAVLLCFVPACFEIAGMVLLAPRLLGISVLDAAIMGSVVAAVSPAVIVPKMLRLMEEGRGTRAGIPQMIMAGASVDDVFVIVLFTAFTGLADGGGISAGTLARIPFSIVLGILAGAACGSLLAAVFRRLRLRDSAKVLILLSISFLLVTLEDSLSGRMGFSGLIAVVAAGVALQRKRGEVAARLSAKYAKLWVAAAPIPDLPDRKTICIMERGNEKCQPKNENTQRRRVTMRPSRRGQCGWSPSRGGPAGRWPRNSASASTRCAAG